MKQIITNKVMNEDLKNDTEVAKIWKGRTPNPAYIARKQCRKCGEIKTVDEFHKNNKTHDGYLHQCKECQTAQMNEHWKTPKGKETVSRAVKKYKQTPKGRFQSVRQSHKKRGGGKVKMTSEQYTLLMETQTHCAICGAEFSRKLVPFTDHIIAIKNEKGKPSPLSEDNIQFLCKHCSSLKKNKTLTQEDILSIRIRRMQEVENG